MPSSPDASRSFLGRPDAIHGEDAEGERAWSLVSFNPDKARTDQGQAITIRAGVP
jgi:hypothetical protein